MKLRTLRLHGFKSFADRTEVVFHDGLTAVVGPNGCGKSNISDAIRWVLGEQRASAIRGAKMEEAIFQGTVHRRPVNRGSVTLVLTNEDGALPVPFSEVEIGRTVYRDGGSEYQLNRTSCRLRDIHDLARDTGLGSNAYSIIESRMIDTILSDRAEERRGLFEEAAGIGKYKDRRKSAARRLERAEVDLQRLEDLLAEVESKVRSLARQKGKAERWRTLRKERLDTEIALARTQLEALAARGEEIGKALATDAGDAPVRSSGVEVAEARVEALRLERLKLERERTEAAGALEGIRSRLVNWEREVAVAAERGENAENRLGRLHAERLEARKRKEEAEAEGEALAGTGGEQEEALAALESRQAASHAETTTLREALDQVRARLQEVEASERELARLQAQRTGDAEGARAREEEMTARLRLLEEEAELARGELAELDGQGDLFTDRLAALAGASEAARARAEELRGRLAGLRAAVDEARGNEIQAQERSASLAGRRGALERMEAEREGVDPVVRALLAAGIPGVEGVLLDAIRAPVEVARQVERYLGTLARGVIVADAGTARAVSAWFEAREGGDAGSEAGSKGSKGKGKGKERSSSSRVSESGGERGGRGGLLLLPLDAMGLENGADAPSPGTLLAAVEPVGSGAPWVRRLLAGVATDEQGGLLTDPLGIVHLGNPAGAGGLLERKEELRALRARAEEAEAGALEAQRAREEAQRTLREAEEALEGARVEAREAEDLHREARSEETARSHRRERILRVLSDVARQTEATLTSRDRAREQAAGAGEATASLAEELAALSLARDEARAAVEDAQARWEKARTAWSSLEVERTRLEAEQTRWKDRLAQLQEVRHTAQARLEGLDQEEVELRAAVEAAGTTRREGKAALETLFREREEAEGKVAGLDERRVRLDETMAEAERGVREAREAERAASDRRHRLELEAGEVEGKLGRIQERLEGEWGRPLATLLEEADPVEGEEEALRARAREVAEALERLGPVNQLAVEEHEEENTRLHFLKEQHDDLVRARNDLRAAIREINQTATRLFHETFEKIRENFRATFLRLFQGGECDLWLSDPEDPLDSAIEIHASPRGKKTQRIDLLSGGERALTALSLLFGIYLVKPSPFCVLDEVDAPLDESNIGRFLHLLQEFKADTQFIVITHNPRTIEAADWIYGVTMEEPGISRIVGVRLEDALEVAGITPV